VLHALKALKQLVKKSYKVGDPIEEYDPFQFHTDTRQAPTVFELVFVGPEQHKYRYHISFNRKEVLSEELSYYPLGQNRVMFRREIPEEGDIHHVRMVDKDIKGPKNYTVFNNQLMLSVFGSVPHTTMEHIYKYFTQKILVLQDAMKPDRLKRPLMRYLEKQEQDTFFSKLNKLICLADTKIANMVLSREGPKDKASEHSKEENSLKLYAQHQVYDAEGPIQGLLHPLPFEQESTGTNFLFDLGGLILVALENGGAVVIDEFDNSLNPTLSRMLVYMFHHPQINRKNAQLIFVSHEPHILDKNHMRADQIWFAEKNDRGETELYSASQFENIREDIPFDSWYLAGKFGAMPNIDEAALLALFSEETPAM
jgi:hypothetical protein